MTTFCPCGKPLTGAANVLPGNTPLCVECAAAIPGEPRPMWPAPVPEHPTKGMHIWGWMTPVELEWLRGTAATMGSVCEVGSLHGRSAFALASGCEGTVYCVDPWDDPEGRAYPSFLGAVKQFGRRVVPVRGFSPGAAAQVPSVDMVFIDGDHSYEQVKQDLRAWRPKALKLICGHDYGTGGYAGVAQAVNEFFAQGSVGVAPGTDIWTVEINLTGGGSRQ